jgi:hypothetical protein
MEGEEDADGKGIESRFLFLDVACYMPWWEMRMLLVIPSLGIGAPSAEQAGM